MENQNIRVSIPWEHSLTNLLVHDSISDPCIALRQWVHFQGVENILNLLSWEEDELKAIPAQQVFTLDDHGLGSYLRTNQTKQICRLITYMKHVFREYNSGIEVRTDPFHPFLPEEMESTYLNHVEDILDSTPTKSHWASTSHFWVHIFIQTYRILTSSYSADEFQEGYQKRDSCIPFPKG